MPTYCRFRGPTSMAKKPTPAPLEDVNWLSDVREVRQPLDQAHPLFVRHVNIASGPVPEPSVPFPEKHPYCEISFNLEGNIVQFIEGEKVSRKAGDLMLLGPGTPHYAIRHSYPHRTVTVHLLPILLFEMGPQGDGAQILNRFTTAGTIADRVIRLPKKETAKLRENFEQMAIESVHRGLGWEFRLRALLMESLVTVVRWESAGNKHLTRPVPLLNWNQIEKTLRYMQEHYSEPLYVKQIASAIGLTPSSLQSAFQRALGMSCMQYLKALRLSHAKALLAGGDARVTEIALAVGFETLSHFNTSFRSSIGMSPTEYMRKIHRKSD